LDAIGELDIQNRVDSYRRFVEPLSSKIRQLPIGQNLFLLDFYSRLLNKTKDVDAKRSELIVKTSAERVSSDFDAYLKT